MDPRHKKKPGTLIPGFEFFRPCFSAGQTHLSCLEYLRLWVDSEEAATDAAVLSIPHRFYLSPFYSSTYPLNHLD